MRFHHLLRTALLCHFGVIFLQADVIDDSLILRLNFDAEPVADVIVDTSPAGGHPGTNSLATWAGAEDGRNGVMSFDGTSPSSITVTEFADLNSPTGAIAFWMKSSLVTAVPNPYAMIFDRRQTPGGGGDVMYQTENGHLNTQAEASGRAQANVRATTGTLTDGKWHHVAYVYDQRATGAVTIYVDGVLDTTGPNTRAWSWVATQPLRLGISEDAFWSGFSGFLDDFRVYKRSLSASEVADLAGLAPTPQIVIGAAGQPQDITVAVGDNPVFSVKATLVNGDPAQLQYQWQKDGTNIPDATNATYIVAASLADSGKKFRAQVTAPGATNIVTSEAMLTVVPEVSLVYSFAAAPEGDQIVDSSPNATKHPGVNFGASWVASEEGRNGVMSFDGEALNSMTIASAPELRSSRGTISFWMKSPKVTALPNAYAVMFDWRETPGTGGELLYQGPNGRLNNQAEGASRAAANSQSTTASVTDGKWHHIAYAYDQSAGGSVTFYVDGVLNTTRGNTAAWSWPEREINIGLSPDTFWSGYTGFLDEFRMVNRVLSGAEIAALAGLGSQPQIVITGQPVGLTAAVNDTPVLSVSATVANGDPSTLRYQWQKDGTDITGATNSTYTLTASTDAKFRVHLAAAGATNLISAEAALTVVPELTVIYSFDAAPEGDVILDSGVGATKHNGVNAGTSWVDAQGGRTGVMSFDGTVPNGITLPAATELNSSRGTIAFWMKSPVVTPTPNPYAMVLDRRETPGAGGDVLYQTPDGNIANQAETAGRSRANEQSSTASLTDDKWHHFAYAYDQSSAGFVKIYVDGILDNSRTNSAAWAWPERDIEIGRSGDPFWSGFSGFLDDFRIYNRVLTDADIVQLSGGTAVAPTMTLSVSGNEIAITWAGSGFALEENANLANPAGWSPVVGNPSSPAKLTLAPAGAKFYRLKK